MVNAHKAWRHSDEKKLSEIINEFLQRGEDIEIAFDAAAIELGRTTRGCKDRWNTLYKKRRLAPVKPIKTHDYSKLFHDFKTAYEEMENTIADLINENKQLKQRIMQLESIETKVRDFVKAI